RLATKLLEAPPMDRAQITDPVWDQRRDTISEVVQKGLACDECRSKLAGIVAEVAWETDLRGVRREIAAHGRGWLRWIRRPYREAIATLRGVMESDLPDDHAERLRIVDIILKSQRLTQELDGETDVSRMGKAAFGTTWLGARSKWADLEAIDQWERSC